jgi:hypothetical protein
VPRSKQSYSLTTADAPEKPGPDRSIRVGWTCLPDTTNHLEIGHFSDGSSSIKMGQWYQIGTVSGHLLKKSANLPESTRLQVRRSASATCGLVRATFWLAGVLALALVGSLIAGAPQRISLLLDDLPFWVRDPATGRFLEDQFRRRGLRSMRPVDMPLTISPMDGLIGRSATLCTHAATA